MREECGFFERHHRFLEQEDSGCIASQEFLDKWYFITKVARNILGDYTYHLISVWGLISWDVSEVLLIVIVRRGWGCAGATAVYQPAAAFIGTVVLRNGESKNRACCFWRAKNRRGVGVAEGGRVAGNGEGGYFEVSREENFIVIGGGRKGVSLGGAFLRWGLLIRLCARRDEGLFCCLSNERL